MPVATPAPDDVDPQGHYLRFPTLYGDRVVFGSEDDLWEVAATGGVARRLTADLAETSTPKLSPDGELLGFLSRNEGTPEVWCMPSMGGQPTRLTFFGHASTSLVGWSPDGRLVAVTASDQPFGWTMAWLVDPTTGALERLPIGPLTAMSFEPGGSGVVIARNSSDPAKWKRYNGGTAGQIWVDRQGDGNYRRVLKDFLADLAHPMWVGNRIYFISDHEGFGNLYSVRPTGSDLRRHTDHDEYYARLASTDGERIVYQHAGDLWIYDPADDTAEWIDVELASPRTQRSRKFVPADKQLTGFALHPAGRDLLVESRGQLVDLPLWEDAPRPVNPADGVRQRLGRFLPDGETIVALGDETGEEQLVVHAPDTGTRTIDIGGIGQPWELAVAPAGDVRVALVTNRNELHVVDIDAGSVTLLDGTVFGALTDAAWSPDGRWIAYSIALSRTTRSIRIADTRSGATYDVTRAEFRDVCPAWSPDGRYLYFLSSRVFDPVADEFFIDLNFPRTVKPFVVPLRAADRSPFRPEPKPMAGDKPDADGGAAAATPTVAIDLDGLNRRVVEVPGPTGRYLKLAVVKDAVLVLSAEVEGTLNRDIFGTTLPSYTVTSIAIPTGKHEPVMTDVADFAVSMDASTIALRSQKRLRVLPAGKPAPKPEELGEDADKPSRASGWVDLERVKLAVNPGAEWRQMYREAWRLQREYFWNEDMSGVDWQRVHDRYEPLLDRIGARSELSDLLWEMQGELGTSHAYEIGGEYREPPAYPVGFLGADIELQRGGRWRVAHIVQADHWDPGKGSSLEAPGVGVKEGDTILAVNGRPVDAEVSPASLLVNQAGTAVELTVGDARGRRPRRVVVTTLPSEQPLRYREWVEGRRRHVHEATDGRVGYLHIPDMMSPGYAEFHRSYLAEMGHDALVVDVRDNRGGYVSALLLEKLVRRRVGAILGRWEPPSSYPEESPAGPMVAVTNQNAGSDGDIFSHSFKMLGLGQLVGTRTWGGVIGIDGRSRLIDGGLTTQPTASFWFADVGWGVENYGTDPDVVVDITPQEWAAGEDPQLDRAIQIVLRELRRHKPFRPEDSPRPRLTLPTLPPRP